MLFRKTNPNQDPRFVGSWIKSLCLIGGLAVLVGPLLCKSSHLWMEGQLPMLSKIYHGTAQSDPSTTFSLQHQRKNPSRKLDAPRNSNTRAQSVPQSSISSSTQKKNPRKLTPRSKMLSEPSGASSPQRNNRRKLTTSSSTTQLKEQNASSPQRNNRRKLSTEYEYGADNEICDSAALMIDSKAECQTANVFLGTPDITGVDVTAYPSFPCGCQEYSFAGNFYFRACAYGTGTKNAKSKPICRVPAAVPSADGGGDPHYKMFFNQLVTVQALCDLNLFSTDALGGVQIHSRHSMPLNTNGKDTGYSVISNLAIRIGDTIWEVVAEGPKIFKNGVEFDLLEEEPILVHAYSDKKDRDDAAPLSYSVERVTKGQRKNRVEFIFTFADQSKVIFRGNKHYKMNFIEVHGFSRHSVVGFLGRTKEKGFFDRQGKDMLSKESSLRNDKSRFSIEAYAQEWQVGVDEPKLFMNNSEYPVAPEKCSFLGKGSIEGLVGNDIVDPGNNSMNHDEYAALPRRKLTVVDDATAEMAREACAHLSDSNPKKKFCIEDVMATEEAELAYDSFYEE